jgi:hypothetical protein
LRRQLRLPEFRQDNSMGGEVETGRGKKGKKAGWHLTLGLKDVIFAGIGVMGLMMMSFALGTLAGRGDIYRLAYSWGLLKPDGSKVVQWTPMPGPPTVALPAAPGTATAPTVASGVAPTPGGAPTPPAPLTAAVKPQQPAPVTGSIAPLPAPAAVKKKGKTGNMHRDHKSREEELRRVRQEVVQKLKFQNSFDTGPKPRLPKSKDHEKAQAKSGVAKAKPTQVRVAQYRTSKEAQAKVAELHKKGVKATLKKTKDSKGILYTVYKTTSPAPPGAEELAQKPRKSNGAPRKPKAD